MIFIVRVVIVSLICLRFVVVIVICGHVFVMAQSQSHLDDQEYLRREIAAMEASMRREMDSWRRNGRHSSVLSQDDAVDGRHVGDEYGTSPYMNRRAVRTTRQFLQPMRVSLSHSVVGASTGGKAAAKQTWAGPMRGSTLRADCVSGLSH